MSPADFDFFRPFVQMPSVPQEEVLTWAQNFIANLLSWLLLLFIIASFVYLVLAGIKYIASQGDASKATEARRAVIYAIIGLVVATLALFIIKATINFITTL